jgi:hypothetical protein
MLNVRRLDLYNKKEKLMNEEYDEVPEFLFIRGVYLAECKRIDQILEEHLLGDGLPEVNDKVFDQLPLVYEGLATWPVTTNTWCWYCAKTFDGVPLFVPKTIEPDADNKYTMTREGCFSSWPCAASYIDREYPRIRDNSEKKNMLKFLYNDMMGKPIINIPSAPNRFDMSRFGGPMSEEEFDHVVLSLLPRPIHPNSKNEENDDRDEEKSSSSTPNTKTKQGQKNEQGSYSEFNSSESESDSS